MVNPKKYTQLETMGIPNNYKQITPRTPRFGNGGIIPKQPAIKLPPKAQVVPRGTPIPKTRYTPLPQSPQEPVPVAQAPVAPVQVAPAPVEPMQPIVQDRIAPVQVPPDPPLRARGPLPINSSLPQPQPIKPYHFRPQPIIPHGYIPKEYAPLPQSQINYVPPKGTKTLNQSAPSLNWLARNFAKRRPRFTPRRF